MTFSCDEGRAARVMLMEFDSHAPDEALVKDALFEAQTRGITPFSPTASATPTCTNPPPCANCGTKAAVGWR